jgi:hypothetical protein
MRFLIQLVSGLLVIGSWIALCLAGGLIPVLLRQSVAVTIINQKDALIGSGSESKLEAFGPIFEFGKVASNGIWLLSTLILVGCIGWDLSRPKQRITEQVGGGKRDQPPNHSPVSPP